MEGKSAEKCRWGPFSAGGEGFTRPLGGDCIGISPLGILGKGRDRGQGRLVEGERERKRERQTETKKAKSVRLKRSVTFNREVTSVRVRHR